jgi:uncharacterized membrane protein HdeD (DUF308 family)
MEATSSSRPPRWLIIIEGLFAIIIGISLIVSPGMAISIIIQVVGLYWLLAGLLAIVSIFVDQRNWGWKLAGGLLGIAAGILVIQHPLWSTVLIPTTLAIVVGVLGVMVGVADVVRAFKGAGWATGVLGALSIVLGVIIFLNPTAAAFASATIIGIIAIVGGLAAIVIALRGP